MYFPMNKTARQHFRRFSTNEDRSVLSLHHEEYIQSHVNVIRARAITYDIWSIDYSFLPFLAFDPMGILLVFSSTIVVKL